MKTDYWATFEEGQFYHVYDKAVGSWPLFREPAHYQLLLDKWREYLDGYLEVYGYCLVPTHFHFLVRVPVVDEAYRRRALDEGTKLGLAFGSGKLTVNEFLEGQFRRFLASYALTYNYEQDRKGPLFGQHIMHIPLPDRQQTLLLIHYLHHHPVRSGLVKASAEWRYSSYNAILSDQPTEVVRDKVLSWFDGKDRGQARAAFVAFHEKEADYRSIADLLVGELPVS